MSEKWIVIGISGVTCAGKTTLAKYLNSQLRSSQILSQDDYFLDVKDPRHTWIPELNHINFDILSSLDMKKMHEDMNLILHNRKKKYQLIKQHDEAQKVNLDVKSKSELLNILNSKINKSNTKILIIEGFCIFNFKPIQYLCDFKYYFTLSEKECFRRRIKRVYEPPDCPGYFEKCVWPEYLNQLQDVQSNVIDVKYFNESTEDALKEVLLDLICCL